MSEEKKEREMLGVNVDMPKSLRIKDVDQSYSSLATPKERKFLLFYDNQPPSSKNLCAAALYAFNCKNKGSARVIGSRLAKKFGLKQKSQPTYPLNKQGEPGRGEPLNDAEGTIRPPDKHKEAVKHSNKKDEEYTTELHGAQPHGKLQQVESAFSAGIIDEESLFKEVHDIAYFYRDKDTSLRALQKLKDWADEKKDEREAMKMSEQDVVTLLADSLARIPKEKYLEVLRLNRVFRQKLIAKRNLDINVEQIIADVHKEILEGKV